MIKWKRCMEILWGHGATTKKCIGPMYKKKQLKQKALKEKEGAQIDNGPREAQAHVKSKRGLNEPTRLTRPRPLDQAIGRS